MPNLFILLALLASSSVAIAAQPPSAGSALQQIPATPLREKVTPQLRIESDQASPSAPEDNVTISVRSLHIVNARAFSETQLLAATGFMSDKALTLSALRELATTITNYYRSHGYFLARAYLPPQDIVDGAVTIAVIEGQYGKVVLRNESGLSNGVAQRLLNGLNSGDVISIAPLESRLLQLSDLPGVQIKSTLVPGASVGASDLIIDVTPGRRVNGSIDVDNSGNRYTGSYRTGATLNVNDPLGLADVATLRALTSWDGLNYGRAAYQLQIDRADIGVAYSALDYELGDDFSSLQAHGTAQIVSLYGRYPLLRSRSSNLYAQIDLDGKTFHDRVDATDPATINDKKANVAMLSLVGDRRDRLAGGGLMSYSFTWSSGRLSLHSPDAINTDATTARSDGHYDKFDLNLSRLQFVTESISLYGALQSQLAAKNLDISEKMALGGTNAVRAYPEGEGYVDQGYVLNVEARFALPKLIASVPGDWQLIGFADSGTGSVNHTPWTDGSNRRTLSGGGVGLNWSDASSFVMKAYYAHKIGAAAATSAPDRDGRFWLSAVTYF